jgi:Mrp family chromosome partitioning ATPase
MIATASEHGEKFAIAPDLALALARAGRRVVLVDLAVAEPSLHRLFGLAHRPGMVDVALGDAPLEATLATVDVGAPVRGATDGPGHDGAAGVFEVLVLGSSPVEPGFLASGAVANVLTRLTERAELVLIDGPPLVPAGEALDVCADALVVVSRADALDGSIRDRVASALELSLATPLGLVLIGGSGFPQADASKHRQGNPARRPEAVA